MEFVRSPLQNFVQSLLQNNNGRLLLGSGLAAASALVLGTLPAKFGRTLRYVAFASPFVVATAIRFEIPQIVLGHKKKAPALPTDVINSAKTHHIIVKSGFYEVVRRITVKIGKNGGTVRTLCPDGRVEEEGKRIRVHGDQSLVTFAVEQRLVDQDYIKLREDDKYRNGKDEPYIYNIADNEFGVLQTWTLNFNRKFERMCKEDGHLNEVVPSAVENDRDFLAKVMNFEENLDVGSRVEELEQRIAAVVHGLKTRALPFKSAVDKIVNGHVEAPAQYVAFKKEVHQHLFIGTVEEMCKFFDSAGVQDHLKAKIIQNKEGKKYLQSKIFSNNIWWPRPQTLELPGDKDLIVVYQRVGHSSFTCFQQLAQFLEANVFYEHELTAEVKDFLDKFEMKEQIGKGNFGTIHRAELKKDTAVNYAVKVFKYEGEIPPLDVRKEIKTFETIRQHPHPCVVTVFLHEHLDDGTADGVRDRFIMEYGREHLWAALVNRLPCRTEDGTPYGAPSLTELIWLGGLFLGMEHLHKNNVVHRDISPGNIIITVEGFAKLIDFGHTKNGPSKVLESWTGLGPIGTPGYQAPELYKDYAGDFENDRKVDPNLADKMNVLDDRKLEDGITFPEMTMIYRLKKDQRTHAQYWAYWMSLAEPQRLKITKVTANTAERKTTQTDGYVAQAADIYSYAGIVYLVHKMQHPPGAELAPPDWSGAETVEDQVILRGTFLQQQLNKHPEYIEKLRPEADADDDKSNWQYAVKHMIHPDPCQRYRHSEIRKLQFFCALNLPANDGGTPTNVNKHCVRTPKAADKGTLRADLMSEEERLVLGYPKYDDALSKKAHWWLRHSRVSQTIKKTTSETTGC